MSAHPETTSSAMPAPKAGAAIGIGLGGIALTAAGLTVGPGETVAPDSDAWRAVNVVPEQG